ncbi:YfjI family protein [Roseomonas xinghualingensis]|uniref:YfjI family protein n=1 Tax=Roseomonas xinghualingensis TaxID=2986475 RepID=UPI0021F1AE86|nr:YfjI family protein [Roseomonas sp. SXEYE001]MCV4209864.1 YfjI family protein [Roseomonas sp. SXEYE001]
MDGSTGPHNFREEAQAAADAAPREKRPLHRDVPAPAPFPVRALGPLRVPVEGLQTRTQAPMALCAQSVLAAATLAAQPHADVLLPTGRAHPLSGLFLTVAGSGERKTSADRIALAEVYAVEAERRAAYEDQLDAYRRDLAAWKEAGENIKKEARKTKGAQDGGRATIRERLAQIGAEPKAPPHPMLLVSDPTPDGLVMHLQGGHPSAGLFTAEGGGFIGGHAMNDDNRMRCGAMLNAIWDGEPIRQTRVLRGTVFLAGRRVTMHLMAQPGVAAEMLGDAMLDDMGLLARCLTVQPETTIGTRLFRDTSEAARTALDEYRARLGGLLRRLPPVSPDDDRELVPRALPLTTEARALWVAFHDAVEGDLGEGGALHPVRAFGAKLAEHAGRLAATLALYGSPDAQAVEAEGMRCGIALAQHYASEAVRLHGAAAVPAEIDAAAKLLRWWQGRADPRADLATVYQHGPYGLRTAEKARTAVAVLLDCGQVRRLPPGTEYEGRARREVWELVP